MPALAVEPTAVALWVVGLLVVVALAGVVLALATDDRDPSIVLGWLLLILLVPVLGLVAYFFIGRNYRHEGTRRRQVYASRAEADARMLSAVTAPAAAGAVPTPVPTPVTRAVGTVTRRVERAAGHEGGFPTLPAETVRLYFAGEDKFRDLLVDLRAARRSILMMYLIWEQDRLTAEVTGVLRDKVRAGVEVRVLYDWLSSTPYKKHELEQLAAAGATVVPCYKRVRLLNYRNHMKMAIIDGEVVYSGGMNMGQEYIDGGERFDLWRDTHFRMTGPVVAPYLSLFATTWRLNGRSEDLSTHHAATARETTDGVPVQVLHSSVATRFPAIRDAFLVALGSARRRVWIQSPYFVPDEPLLTGMCTAAAAGTDVRLMMTGVPDKKVPFYAAHAYFPTLLAAGVKVHKYDAGFLHAKTVTVDDDLAIIGTCNWDIRSLILHDEVVAIVYDDGVVRSCAEQFERDLDACSTVTAQGLAALSARERLRNSLCRLPSRLL